MNLPSTSAIALLSCGLAGCGASQSARPDPVVVELAHLPPAPTTEPEDCKPFERSFEPVLNSELGISLPNRQAFIGTKQDWDAEWKDRLAERETAIQHFLASAQQNDLECLLHAFTHRYPAQGDGLAWSIAARVLTRACVPRAELQRRSRLRTAAWESHLYTSGGLEDLLNHTVGEAQARRRNCETPTTPRTTE